MRNRATQFLLSALLFLLSLPSSARLTTPLLPDFSGSAPAPLSRAADAAELATLAYPTDNAIYAADADIVLAAVLVSFDDPETAYVVFFSCDQKVAYWFSHVGQLPLGLEGWLYLEADNRGKHAGYDFGTTAWIEYLPSQDRKIEFEAGDRVELAAGRVVHVHNYGNENGPEPWRRERGKDGKWHAVPGPDGKRKGRLGINYVHYLNRRATHQRAMWVDDAAETKLFEFIAERRRMGVTSWTESENCAWFAAEAWRIATGESIDPAHGKVVTDIVPADRVEEFVRDQGMPEILGKMAATGAAVLPCPCPVHLAEAIEEKNGGRKQHTVPRPDQP